MAAKICQVDSRQFRARHKSAARVRSARIARADMSASRTARAVSGASLGSGARPLRRRLVRAPNGSHPTKKVPSTVIRCGSKVARQGAYRVTDLPEDESDLLARIHTHLLQKLVRA